MQKDEILFSFIFALMLALALVIYYFGYISIILVASFIVLALSFFNNRFLLILLLIFIPVFPKLNLLSVPGSSVAVRVEDVLIAVVILSVVLAALIRKGSFKMDPFRRNIILFISVSFISLFVGILQGSIEIQPAPILFFLRRIEYLSLFFVAYLITDSKSIGIIKKTVAPAFMAVALVAVMQKIGIMGGFFHGQYVPSVGDRVFSTFSTPGELAAYIAIIFTFSVLGMLDEKPFRKTIWLIIAGLQLFVLFLSVTRVEFLSIPFGLAAMAIMKGKVKQTLALIVILAVLAGLMMPSSLKDKFSIIFRRETVETITNAATGIKRVDINRTLEMQQLMPSGYDLSALTRLYFWINAFDVFKTYPAFGAGQSAMGDVVDNNYLRVLGENGLIGFAVFIMLIYHIWRNCVKVYNNEAMSKEFRDYALFVLVMLMNMLIIALMGDVFEMSKIAFLFWLLVGVFFKAKNLEESGQAT